jgi:hypothetical protein
MAKGLVKTDKNKRKASKKTLTDAVNAGEYETNPKLRNPDRSAHFLDWAAKHYPKSYVPYNYLLKAIMGYERTPRLDSEDVDRLRSNLTRIRTILQEIYGRDLDTQPGVGVRATVDDADTTTVALPKKMRRLRSAQVGLKKTVDLIDLSKLPSTADMVPWKRWLTTDVKTIMKTLDSPDFAKRMLPPGTPDKDDKGGDGGE